MEHQIASFIETLQQTGSMYERLLTRLEMGKKAVVTSNVDQLTTAGAENRFYF